MQQVYCCKKGNHGNTTGTGTMNLPHHLQGEGGRICLEGTVCDEYYKVRQLLYEQFAII